MPNINSVFGQNNSWGTNRYATDPDEPQGKWSIPDEFLIDTVNKEAFPNERYRNNFVRMAQQDPGGFYAKYGLRPEEAMAPGTGTGTGGGTGWSSDIAGGITGAPAGGITGGITGNSGSGVNSASSSGSGWSSGLGSLSNSNWGDFSGYDTGSGGTLFGSDPNWGGVIGTGLGAFAGTGYLSGPLGQLFSGTPESLTNSLWNSGINYGLNELTGGYAGPARALYDLFTNGVNEDTLLNAGQAGLSALFPQLGLPLAAGRTLYNIINAPDTPQVEADKLLGGSAGTMDSTIPLGMSDPSGTTFSNEGGELLGGSAGSGYLPPMSDSSNTMLGNPSTSGWTTVYEPSFGDTPLGFGSNWGGSLPFTLQNKLK